MMHTLFRIPGLEHDVPAYGFMMMLGFFAAIIWATKRAEKSQADPDVILNCGFIALIAGGLWDIAPSNCRQISSSRSRPGTSWTATSCSGRSLS